MILYIYGGNSNENIELIDNSYIYNISRGKINNINSGNCLNDSSRFNDLGLEIRDDYLKFIYEINKNYIKNNFIFDKKLSLYFISDLSGKRTEAFDTYNEICHILLISEKIDRHDITDIVFVECSNWFEEAARSKLLNKCRYMSKKSYEKKKPLYKLILSHSIFYFKSFVKLIIIKFYMQKKDKSEIVINRLFLSRFPNHFNEKFNHEKYKSLVTNKDYFLISMISDGMHQTQTIKQLISELKRLSEFKKNTLLIDENLTYRDLILYYFRGIKFFFRLQKLIKNEYIFKDINISNYINWEIKYSFLRIPRLLMYNNSIKETLRNCNVKDFIYYLHEYSYGKFFTYMLQTYFSKINLIGFQHGGASRRSLLYYMHKKEMSEFNKDYLQYMPIPDCVWAEDENSKFVYEESGYHNVIVQKNIPRLEYLNNIEYKKTDKYIVLIACGLYDTQDIVDSILDEVGKNSKINYILKLHPKVANNKSLKTLEILKFKNITLSDKSIEYYLSFVNEVISTYSSVGYEAYIMGIKSRILLLSNKINESPLLDKNYKEKNGNYRIYYK